MKSSRNFSIFSVAKKARSYEASAREETLLTAILGWAFERSGRLLTGFLNRALPQSVLTKQGPWIRDSIPLDVRVEEPVYLDGDRYRLDLIIEWSDFEVVVEFKVTPGNLERSQLETYHRVLSGAGLEYVLIVVSPDGPPLVQTLISQLRIGETRTYHLPWGELYNLAVQVQEGEEESSDSVVAREVKVAIEMAPGLKPFTGFTGAALSALQNIDEADRQVGELFTALRGILTAPQPQGLGLAFRRTHAEDPSAFRLPSSIWDEYVDVDLRLPANVPSEEVIMGPWFRLAGKDSLYKVYLETTSARAAMVFRESLGERSQLREGVETNFRSRFPGIVLSTKTEASQVGLYADVPLKSPILVAEPASGESPVVTMTIAVLRFFREEFAKRALER